MGSREIPMTLAEWNRAGTTRPSFDSPETFYPLESFTRALPVCATEDDAPHTEGTDHLRETLRAASTVAQREALTSRARLDEFTIDEAAAHALREQGWESI